MAVSNVLLFRVVFVCIWRVISKLFATKSRYNSRESDHTLEQQKMAIISKIAQTGR